MSSIRQTHLCPEVLAPLFDPLVFPYSSYRTSFVLFLFLHVHVCIVDLKMTVGSDQPLNPCLFLDWSSYNELQLWKCLQVLLSNICTFLFSTLWFCCVRLVMNWGVPRYKQTDGVHVCVRARAFLKDPLKESYFLRNYQIKMFIPTSMPSALSRRDRTDTLPW